MVIVALTPEWAQLPLLVGDAVSVKDATTAEQADSLLRGARAGEHVVVTVEREAWSMEFERAAKADGKEYLVMAVHRMFRKTLLEVAGKVDAWPTRAKADELLGAMRSFLKSAHGGPAFPASEIGSETLRDIALHSPMHVYTDSGLKVSERI